MQFHMIVCVLDVFIGFVPPISMPAASQRPKKKTLPWICRAHISLFSYFVASFHLVWCAQ
jgi:hypothetical protein